MARAVGKLGPEWPTEVDGFQLAEMTMVSVRHLRDLKKKGIVFQGSKPGMYLFPESFHGFLDYRRRLAAEAGPQSEISLLRAKTMNVKRQIKEHELAQIQSEILTVAEAEEAWRRLAGAMKAAFLSVVADIKSALPHLTDHDECTLRTLAVDALEDLAREAEDSVIGADPDLLRPTDDERAGTKPRRKRK